MTIVFEHIGQLCVTAPEVDPGRLREGEGDRGRCLRLVEEGAVDEARTGRLLWDINDCGFVEDWKGVGAGVELGGLGR